MTNSNTDFIASYAQNGFALFELCGKEPVKGSKEWQLTQPNNNLSFLDFESNYGVVLPKNILVIDVDCRDNKPGVKSFKQLTQDMNLETAWEQCTYTVKTGSGGFHIYLTKDVTIKIKKNLKQYPGIDFLSKGSYVVGAGSIHPDTKLPYSVVHNTPGDICPAPFDLTLLFPQHEIEQLPVSDQNFIDDSEHNIEQFKSIISTYPDVPHGGRTNSTYIVAARGRDLGLSLAKNIDVTENFYNAVKLKPPLNSEEVTKIVKSVYTYAQKPAGNTNPIAIFDEIMSKDNVDFSDPAQLEKLGFNMDKNKRVLKTLHNAINYIKVLPSLTNIFKFNVFSGYIEIDSKAPWFRQRGTNCDHLNDEDVTLLKYFIAQNTGVEFQTELLTEAVIVTAHRHHFNPVKSFLSSLIWDGVPRLDTWLIDYAGVVDTVYTRAVARKTLCAAVKRIMQPGCKWDYVLILEGAQGIGKSTMCRILGRLWGGDMNLDPHNKDSVAMMLGKWVIELSEMTALRWADANALKSFITREKDTVRLSYARHAKDIPRQSIFIGTVNPELIGYLNDATGNRRFWIVHIPRPIKIKEFENVCDQIWAEAVYKYEKEMLYLNADESTLQTFEALSRMPEDPIRSHVAKFVQENPEKDVIDMAELFGHMGIAITKATKQDQSRLVQALTDLRWERRREMIDGTIKTTYHRPLKEILERQLKDL